MPVFLDLPPWALFTAPTSKLRHRKARRVRYQGRTYNIGVPRRSTRPNKKYMVTINYGDGRKRTVHWGDKRYQDYLQHKDPKRRKNFKRRHGGIKTKDGSRAVDNPLQPAYYAYRYNW